MPVMDGFSFHPVRHNSSVAVDALPPDPDHDRARSTRTSSCGCSARPSTARRRSARGCRSSTTSSGSRRAIPAEKASSTAASSRATTRPVAEATQAAHYRRGAPARVLPAERRRLAPLPHPRRADLGRLAVRALSTRTARPRRVARARAARRCDAGGHAAPSARCPIVAKVVDRVHARPNVRSRSDASAPAPTGPGSLRLPRRTRGRRRRRGRAAAGLRRPVRLGAAREHAAAGTSSPVSFVDAALPGTARRARPARRMSVRSLLAAALACRGCGARRRASAAALLVGAVDDAVRARPGPALDAAAGRRLRRGRDHERLAARPDRADRGGARRPPQRASTRPPATSRIFLAVYQPGSATTPLTPEARRQFAAYVAAIVRDAAGDPRRDRRQRAEPEPLLAAAVRRRAASDVAAPRLPGAARRDLRRAQGGRPGRRRDRAAPSRRAGSTGPARAATRTRRRRFIRDLGAAYRASGRDEPPIGRLRVPPLPGELEHPARPADRPDVDVDRCWPTTTRSSSRCSTRRSGRAGGRRCRSSTASSASRRRSRRQGAALRGRASRATPVDEATQADYYRRAIELAACQPNVAGLLLFHSHDEPDLDRLAVRRLLRGRHAEVEPRARSAALRASAAAKRLAISRRDAASMPGAASTSPTPSTGSTRPGGGCRSRSATAMKDAFADVVEELERPLRAPARLLDAPASAPTATSSSGRSPSATRTSASSARR